METIVIKIFIISSLLFLWLVTLEKICKIKPHEPAIFSLHGFFFGTVLNFALNY